MYTKVCAGMLDTMVRQEPGDKKWQLVLPGCSAVDCSYVWLQARCVALEPAGPARKHDTATLDDGTGRVLVLTEKGSSRVVPEKYYMVLGKLLRSAAYGDLWIIRPHKLVGLFRACVLRLKCTTLTKIQRCTNRFDRIQIPANRTVESGTARGVSSSRTSAITRHSKSNLP